MPDSPLKPTPHQRDLQWLACPVCHQPLALTADCVDCQGCRRRYPLLDGIPILLADLAS